MTTEDEMGGQHHRLDAHEFEQTPGGSEGLRSLVCCSSWGGKEMDMTEQLKSNSYDINRCSYRYIHFLSERWCPLILHENIF